MLMPPEGRIKYPPRSYQNCGELGSESQASHSQREGSGLYPSSTVDQPNLINRCLTQCSNNLSKNSPQSSIIDDWTWGSFAIGVGAGAVHIILADLNRQNKRLIICLEVLFYFTDMITFLCNIGILITQNIRNTRGVKRTFENTEKSAILSLIPINLATIVIGSFRYGLASGWLQLDGAICLFHCYIILLISLLIPHFLMWFKIPHSLEKLPTTFYLLPIPTLLTGVMASHLLEIMPFDSKSSLNVLITGCIFGGFSMLLALFYLFLFFFRIILHGHGSGEQTVVSILVAAFPAFCAQTVIGLGNSSRIIFVESPDLNLNAILGEIWFGAGILVGLMFLGTSLALIFMTVSNSWWKTAGNLRPKLTLWMISISCCSWAVSSACSPLCIIFNSAWLQGFQWIFMMIGLISYLVMVPFMIARYFKRISGKKTCAPCVCPTIGFPLPSQDPLRSTELQNFSFPHHNSTERRTQSNLADRSSVWKPHQTRNSGFSQATLVLNQNPKPDPNGGG